MHAKGPSRRAFCLCGTRLPRPAVGAGLLGRQRVHAGLGALGVLVDVAARIVAAAGPQADCVQFVEYVQRNVALNEFRTGLKASTKSAACYVRSELSTALRRSARATP